MYADVIVDITHEKLDKVFQYRVPEALEESLRTGTGVIVPFGRSNRETKGYIVGFSETCDYDADKIKEILRADTSSVAIEARLVALAAWMKEYYGGTMIQALKTVLPIKRTEQQKELRILKRCISREAGEKKLEEYLQITCIGDAGTGACRRFNATKIHRTEIRKLIKQLTKFFRIVTVDLFIIF